MGASDWSGSKSQIANWLLRVATGCKPTIPNSIQCQRIRFSKLKVTLIQNRTDRFQKCIQLINEGTSKMVQLVQRPFKNRHLLFHRERPLKCTRIRNKPPRLDTKLVHGPQGENRSTGLVFAPSQKSLVALQDSIHALLLDRTICFAISFLKVHSCPGRVVNILINSR